jgi:hypothetical protein
MTYDQFAESIGGGQPPEGLSPYLLSLWHERSGDWDRAHSIVQDIETAEASLVHAYLHRREGDESNAGYWYRRAGRQYPSGVSLDEEWRSLVATWVD